MKKTLTKSGASASFRYAATVDVTRPDFTLLSSVKHLDVGRLAKVARAQLEIGYFESDCCRKTVRATVRKGMVTALRVDPCEDDPTRRIPPELEVLVQKALKRIGPGGKPPFRAPMPVAAFLSNAHFITVDTITCVRICILGFCFVCCTTVDPKRIDCGSTVVVRR